MPASPLKTWTPDAVQEAEDKPRAFAEYAQQTLGVPWPTAKDLVILRKKAKDFFEHYPDADWRTLCRVVSWAANRKRRYSRVWMLVEDFRKAWASGALPELDPNTRRSGTVEEEIFKALETETDETWRRRLLLAQGAMQQEEVLAAWRSRDQA